MRIKKVVGRQILDSRGTPTVECDLLLESGVIGRAQVPSGASTGKNEALELRDGDLGAYFGKGVLKAVNNINREINQLIVEKNPIDQQEVDGLLVDLDGTENKSVLGANAILAVSIAFGKAMALEMKMPLYKYFQKISASKADMCLPVPMMNVINGGKHADFAADIQEFMILPIGADSFSLALRTGAEIFHELGKIVKNRGYVTTVGDEGGYAPKMRGNSEALEMILEAIGKAGYKAGENVYLGIDAAASVFYKNGRYTLGAENRELGSEEMVEWLKEVRTKYPVISIEDGLGEEDWNGWKELTRVLGNGTQIVGDDLFVTNTRFLKRGIEEMSANAILIKPNQIGTISETIAAVDMARAAGWKAIISHRSGETEDTTISHLVVGLGTGQIKTGSLSRTERVAKYNELLRIEEELGKEAVFAGRRAIKQ